MEEVKIVYRNMAAVTWKEKLKWCEENLSESSYYLRYPWIEFDNEKDYSWFVLRWS